MDRDDLDETAPGEIVPTMTPKGDVSSGSSCPVAAFDQY